MPRKPLCTLAALGLLGLTVFTPAQALENSPAPAVSQQVVIQEVNETSGLYRAESIRMETSFSNQGAVSTEITFTVKTEIAADIRQIITPNPQNGTLREENQGDQTVFTVSISGVNPQDFQKKFVRSADNPTGYLPGARFDFVIGEGFSLWPEYVFYLEAPFVESWFMDGVAGEYSGTFSLPWLNSVKKDFIYQGQTYLYPADAQVEGGVLTVTDRDGVLASDAQKGAQRIQFAGQGPQLNQVLMMGGGLLAGLLLVLGLLVGVKKRRKKRALEAEAAQVAELERARREEALIQRATSEALAQSAAQVAAVAAASQAVAQPKVYPLNDPQPVTAPIALQAPEDADATLALSPLAEVAAPAEEVAPIEQDQLVEPAAEEITPAEVQPEAVALEEAGAEENSTEEISAEAVSAEDSLAEEGEASAGETVVPEAAAADEGSSVAAGLEETPAPETVTEEAAPAEVQVLPASNLEEATSDEGPREPWYDYEAQEWKGTEGWQWHGQSWMREPWYDFQAQAWQGTEGWQWHGEVWLKEPWYDFESQTWQGTEGWQSDGKVWWPAG